MAPTLSSTLSVCLLAACLLAGPAHAADLRLCVDQNSHPPFMLADGAGLGDRLIELAAAEAGIVLVRHNAPVVRCSVELKAGHADGFPVTPYAASLHAFLAYPMAGGKPDRARAVMTMRQLLFRRTGSPAAWDGKHISGTAKPVLVTFGSIFVRELLDGMHHDVDDNGKSLEKNFTKLAAGRGDLAVGFAQDGLTLLADPRFAGKIEALPLPLAEVPYFMTVTNSYYRDYPESVERLWRAMARLRQLPEFSPLSGSAQAPKALVK